MPILPADFDINNTQHLSILSNYLSNKPQGYYAINVGSGVGSYIYNTFTDTFIQIPNSTFIKQANDPKLYVTVDNRFHPAMIELPLKVTVVVRLKNVVSKSIDLTNKITDIIVQFINSKEIEENIYFSDLINILKQVPVIENVRIVEPKFDIVFNYDVNNLELTDFLTYQAEQIYTTKESVSVVYE
ncbi:MAG: hypothetical protein QW806_10155 [Nitrososphaerota archaeon]